jgi:hypothetical protein
MCTHFLKILLIKKASNSLKKKKKKKDNELNKPQILSNFQKLRLGGFKGPLHSSIQICNNFHFFLVSINNLGHTLVIIVDKQNKVFTTMQFEN